MTTQADEQSTLIASLAARIRERGLETHATLFLELVKPLGFLGSQLVLMFGPLFSAVPPTRLAAYAALLEDRQAVDELLAAIDSRPARTAD